MDRLSADETALEEIEQAMTVARAAGPVFGSSVYEILPPAVPEEVACTHVSAADTVAEQPDCVLTLKDPVPPPAIWRGAERGFTVKLQLLGAGATAVPST